MPFQNRHIPEKNNGQPTGQKELGEHQDNSNLMVWCGYLQAIN
jgi:hypothetical protein